MGLFPCNAAQASFYITNNALVDRWDYHCYYNTKYFLVVGSWLT